MIHLSYRNFDLSLEAIEAAPGGANRYRVRVLDSPAGQAAGEFVLPFSPQDLEILFLRIGRPRRGVRSLNSSEGQAALAFGRKLYEALFSGGVQAGLLRSLDLVEAQGEGLRVRLRLTGAPGLVELPWEFLYDTTHERFLAHSTVTPLVRYLDLPRPMQPLPVQPPLQMLVLIANPYDHNFGRLDVEAEWGKVQTALAPLQEQGLIAATRLESATLAALQGHLRRNRYHIFHFIGHGGFDPANDEGVLLLEDEYGRSRLVGGRRLGALLHDDLSLRLALLNACEGARTGPSDPFAGVAQHLLQQGLPAVIAMQFEITDRAAITLAREFYAALADNYPLEAALAEARKAIFSDDNDVEWATPVLYLRTPDGRLFDLPTLKPMDSPTAAGPAALREQLEPSVAPPAADHTQPNPTVVDRAESPVSGKEVRRRAARSVLPVAKDHGAQPTAKHPGRRWLVYAGAFIGVLALLISAQMGYRSWQAAQAQATETAKAAQAQATETAKAAQAQATATAMAAQARAAMEATAPALLPFVERFGMHFVHVPAGTFTMGSLPDVGQDNERPAHEVALDAFWIGQTEVTNAQYRLFVEAGGYADETLWTPEGWQWRTDNNITQPARWDDSTWNQLDHPVVGVSWYEATAYTAWLAQETGLGVRLPSEAEWERAARGDDGRSYPWGNAFDGTRLNYCDVNCEQDWKDSTVDDGYALTAPVGSYPDGASPYDALDMAGNVWEWVTDWYDARYYAVSPVQNPMGPASGEARVVRGGSWFGSDRGVRAAARNGYDPPARYYGLGFRVVVSPGF
jgi:formylglycine-generating enzyme required for sulfatase activity